MEIMYEAAREKGCDQRMLIGACAALTRVAFEYGIAAEFRLAAWDEAMAFHRDRLKESLG